MLHVGESSMKMSSLSALKQGKLEERDRYLGDGTSSQQPFATLPNVVMTPHIGASTTEAQLRIAESVAARCQKPQEGKSWTFQ